MSQVQEPINAYWTRRAPSYDDYQQRPERVAADRRAWADVWAAALPGTPVDVLDVGTGSGHAAISIAGLGHRVTGIDLADGMLTRARLRAREASVEIDFREGDAVRPDFPDGSFAAVTGRYVLWTLRDPVAAARNWLRLLQPGGVVAMVDSTWFPDGVPDLYGLDGPDSSDRRTDDLLPLAGARSIEPSVAALRAGGLVDVRATHLRTIRELDERFGVAPGHHITQQYLITGHRPG